MIGIANQAGREEPTEPNDIDKLQNKDQKMDTFTTQSKNQNKPKQINSSSLSET